MKYILWIDTLSVKITGMEIYLDIKFDKSQGVQTKKQDTIGFTTVNPVNTLNFFEKKSDFLIIK